ncbi:MAG: restriction endonuclease [Xanthomonadaceae bacterium]|nr:restriction endonuclease [Xanthomonadaceae bacterium]
MIAILLALCVFALSGFGLSYWLKQAQSAQPSAEPAARGAEQLAQLRWRDFTKLVLQAMHGRGYRPVIEEGMPADGIPTDGSDILLERNGAFALLSCKYGTGSVVSAQALLGLSKSANLRGADNVIVVTPGRFDEEAERIAVPQHLELIDGSELWPEVRPYVARPQEAEPTPAAPKPNATLLAWGGAAFAGLVVWFIAQGLQSEPDVDEPAPAAIAAPAAAPKSAPAAVPATPAVAAPVEFPTDPVVIEQHRREAANAISTLFGVDRALWSTQSTLMVYLSSEQSDPINELCPLLERYPELASSRVQLQPPPGSTKAVRFKQCRTY